MTQLAGHRHPPHRVALPGTGGWSAWRTVLLRGTGFPARRLRLLGEPALAVAADDAHATSPDDAADARGHYRELFAEAERRCATALRTTFVDDRLREALVWQNRHFHDVMLPAFLEGRGSPSKLRQRQRMLARYLQRYCVKNDTIGFFGPMTWIELADDAPSVLPPRPRELARRRVRFEGWAIDALARSLARDRALRPWMVPRLLPFHILDGEHLQRPLVSAALRKLGLPAASETAGAETVSAVERTVLAACDGERTAREVAARVRDAHPDVGEGEVFRRLERFVQQGIVAWDLEVPMVGDPERALRCRLQRIGDAASRTRALAVLDALASGRENVARAAGDRRALSVALSDLEADFERRTGQAATRAGGQVYAARTLLYEDCRLDLPACLGREVLAGLGPPLGLVLTSARWLTHRVAAGFRQVFDGIYDQLSRERRGTAPGGSSSLDLASFSVRVQPLLAAPRSRPLRRAGGQPGESARLQGRRQPFELATGHGGDGSGFGKRHIVPHRISLHTPKLGGEDPAGDGPGTRVRQGISKCRACCGRDAGLAFRAA